MYHSTVIYYSNFIMKNFKLSNSQRILQLNYQISKSCRCKLVSPLRFFFTLGRWFLSQIWFRSSRGNWVKSLYFARTISTWDESLWWFRIFPFTHLWINDSGCLSSGRLNDSPNNGSRTLVMRLNLSLGWGSGHARWWSLPDPSDSHQIQCE